MKTRTKEPNQQPTANHLPDYLKDLNKSNTIFVGREYLQGLPVSPTKRKQFATEGDKSSCSCDDEDSFCKTLPINDASKKRWNRSREFIILLLPLFLAVAAAVIMRRKRVFLSGGLSNDNQTSTPARRKKRKKKKGKKSTLKNRDNDTETISMDAVHKLHEASQIIDDANTTELPALGQLAPTNGSYESIQYNDDFNAANTVASSLKSAGARNGLCLSNFSIDQVAQIWEARGLNRQKSLELAAHFEMQMLFFREMLHFLSTASFHFIKKIELMQSKCREQTERHHQEIVDAPHHEKILRHRKHISYMLLKAPILTRCIFTAMASKFYFTHAETIHRFTSVKTVLSQILSSICPDCSIPNFGVAQLSWMPLFAPGFWRSLTFQGVELACTCLCAVKIILFLSCLMFCHHFISKSSCTMIAIIFINWRSILEVASAVVAMNVILTVLARRSLDSRVEHMTTKEAANYYDSSISMCEVFAHIVSLFVGCYLSL